MTADKLAAYRRRLAFVEHELRRKSVRRNPSTEGARLRAERDAILAAIADTEPTDALDRIAAGLSVSYGELAEVDPARCPSSPDRRGPHRPDDTTDPLTCAECGQIIDARTPYIAGAFDPATMRPIVLTADESEAEA